MKSLSVNRPGVQTFDPFMNTSFILKTSFWILLVALFVTSCTPATVEPEPTTGTIFGVITEAITGYSVSQVSVTTTNSSSSVTTDVDGYFQISNVVPGDYTLIATRRGFENKSISVSVAAGLETKADFVLDQLRGVRVVGSVRDKISKQLIDGAIVSSTPFVGSDLTDTLGRFSLKNIIPGTYTFTASIGEYLPASNQVVVENGRDSVVVSFDVVPIFGRIEGIVRSVVNNSPLAGVNIYTIPATSSVLTDQDGRFIIERVSITTGALTTFTITAELTGYLLSERGVSVSPGRTTTADVLLTPAAEDN